MADLEALVDRLNREPLLNRDAVFDTKAQGSASKFIEVPEWHWQRIDKPAIPFCFWFTATDADIVDALSNVLVAAGGDGTGTRRYHVTFVNDEEVRPGTTRSGL